MNKPYSINELELARFGEYILKSRIVPGKYAPFYARWVRKFLCQTPDKAGVTLEDRIVIFLDNLKSYVEPWQIDQAEKAVRLYFTHYLALSGTERTPTCVTPDAIGRLSKTSVMDAARKLIRLRHYSCRTEHTYLGWMDRFFRYLASVEKPADDDLFRVAPQEVKDYLAYLAIKERVAASTQNQAFNSLLFMCREVLQMDLGDLSHNVRARQGADCRLYSTPMRLLRSFHV